MNSLSILAAALVFMLFGYLSLVRISWRQRFAEPASGLGRLLSAQGGLTAVFMALGQSFIFLSLPAVSLLLFWGWGPALLWLLIFHLLGEVMHQLLSAKPANADDLNPASSYLQPTNSVGVLLNLLAQLLLSLCVALAITLMAGLLDQQPGLVFALAGSLLAISVLRRNLSPVATINRALTAFAILAGGLIFAHNLGISIYGSWAPAPELLPWLVFNNSSLIAMGLIWAAFALVQEVSLIQNLARVVGAIILLLAGLLTLNLIWQQPVIDAPLHSSQLRSAELPMFAGVSLFLFSGVLSLWLRLMSPLPAEPRANLVQQISISLVQLTVLIIVCLALAAALGIGAWNTHYIEWSNPQDLREHFALAYDSLLSLSGASEVAGDVSHTIFVIAFCLIGFSFTVFCVGKLRLVNRIAAGDAHATGVKRLARVPGKLQIALIFLLGCWFLADGIPLSIWMAICMLAWLLLVTYQVQYLADMTNPEQSVVLPASITLGLAALGELQLVYMLVSQALQANWLLAITAGLILMISATLWWQPCWHLLQQYRERRSPALFDD